MAFYSMGGTKFSGDTVYISFALYAPKDGIDVWEFETWAGHEAEPIFYAIGNSFYEQGEIENA